VAANPEVASRAAAFAMPGVAVDGNDIIAVYEAAAEARERAINGFGPTLIECKTYRHGGHYLGDQLYGTYRTKDEVDIWTIVKDPIKNFRTILKEVYMIAENMIEEVEASVKKEIQEACEYAEKSPLPDPLTVEKYLFSEVAK
jgi:TPP-dependent pyruvate/acetoin dehydrogenase alpha subunit